jgi:GNAT superfamily N-acetyltransferase
MMNAILYRPAEIGDEHQISACMWAAADLWELTDGTTESVAEWKQISDLEELRARILSSEKTLVSTWNGIVVSFIAFKRGNHLSLLFVRREFSGQGIGRELFTRCTNDLDEITVNSSDAAVGFYQKVGFVQTGDRFFKNGIWGTPMKWAKADNDTNTLFLRNS